MKERWFAYELGVRDSHTGRYISLVSDFGKLASEMLSALNNSGKTPAEQRVIDAARAAVPGNILFYSTPYPDQAVIPMKAARELQEALSALGAEDAPKPRYEARDGRVWDAALGAWLSVGVIASRLNAAEQR